MRNKNRDIIIELTHNISFNSLVGKYSNVEIIMNLNGTSDTLGSGLLSFVGSLSISLRLRFYIRGSTMTVLHNIVYSYRTSDKGHSKIRTTSVQGTTKYVPFI